MIIQKKIISDIKECAEIDIPIVVIHINDFMNCPAISEIGLNNIKSIVLCAEENNVKVAIENNRFFAPLKYIFDNINSDYLGFCFDSGHEMIDSEKVDYLKSFGNRLITMHMDDNLGNRDAHLLPYDGKIDWDRIKEYFSNMSTLEYISLEVSFNRNYEESDMYSKLSAESFLELAFKRAKRLAAL